MSPILPKAFVDNPEAHLRYAAAIGGKPGVAIVRQHLRDGTWANTATTAEIWFNTANHLSDVLPYEQCFADVAAIVGTGRQHKRGLLTVLRHLLPTLTNARDRKSIARLFAAFLEYAEPGDAGVLLDALTPMRRSAERIPPLVIEWLLRRGTGELRAKDRASEVAPLAIQLARGSARDRRRATRSCFAS